MQDQRNNEIVKRNDGTNGNNGIKDSEDNDDFEELDSSDEKFVVYETTLNYPRTVIHSDLVRRINDAIRFEGKNIATTIVVEESVKATNWAKIKLPELKVVHENDLKTAAIACSKLIWTSQRSRNIQERSQIDTNMCDEIFTAEMFKINSRELVGQK